jgi:hypothetical protein
VSATLVLGGHKSEIVRWLISNAGGGNQLNEKQAEGFIPFLILVKDDDHGPHKSYPA